MKNLISTKSDFYRLKKEVEYNKDLSQLKSETEKKFIKKYK